MDRQTILRLKIESARNHGLTAVHFEEEDRALRDYLEQHWFQAAKQALRNDFDDYSGQMLRVNKALWDLEDEIRGLQALSLEKRGAHTDRIVTIAFEIPRLNDERARLVEKINALFDLKAPEKLYKTPEAQRG